LSRTGDLVGLSPSFRRAVMAPLPQWLAIGLATGLLVIDIDENDLA
jgi:hypothetical protein